MKKPIVLLLFLFVLTAVFADWSVDAGSPNLIAGFTGEQVIPKVAVTNSGKTYVCRFDNSSGAYKVYLNLLSPQGSPMWPDPVGLLVSEHAQMTWLTDYDMTADSDGNAVIVFQDIRNAGVNNVVAYKISPNRTFLWGADGVALSADTNTDLANMAPIVFNSSDNSTYVAWQHSASTTSIFMNRLSPEGQKLWGENGISIAPMQGSFNWPQIIQGDADNILLKYYQDTGPFWSPTRHVYVAKYDTTGQRVWNALMTDAGGLPAWQQVIPFESDGAGGGILAWYEDRDSNQDQDVYIQRVNSAGTTTMPDDGALITQDTVNQQYYPRLAVDEVNQQVYAFYRVTNGNQDQYGIGRQLLDFTGNRLWGDAAPLIVEIGSEAADMIGAYYSQAGAVCVYEHGADYIYASSWRSSGNQGWQAGPTLIASTPITKYHYDFDVHPDQWMVLAWEQGSSDMDISAMRLNSNGSLGMEYPPPRVFSAVLEPPNTVVLTWQHPSLYWMPWAYRFYMDDVMVQALSGDQTTFTISGISPGTHSFYLIANYNTHDSVPTETVFVTIEPVANNDATVPLLQYLPRLTPNPFQRLADLSFTLNRSVQDGRISVYNLKGQKVAQHTFTGKAGNYNFTLGSALLPISGSGIYLIRLDLDGTSRTIKAIVTN